MDDRMTPWCCPWCGEPCEELNDVPDGQRSIIAYDMWLEAHVLDCKPYKDEHGLEVE